MAAPVINILDNNRIVYMMGYFNEEKAKEIITRLWILEALDPNKDILLYIDSYGGVIHSFLAMHDVIKLLRCDVCTICIGKAMSCGQMLLISGTKGKRFITPNARVLIHELSSWTHGKLREMEIDINEAKELNKILIKLIIKYTKITKTQLKEVMCSDSYFSAEDVLKMGVVDHIISKPKDLYSKIK